MKNCLDKKLINYSVKLIDGLKDGKRRYIKLDEHIDGLNRNFSNNIGIIYSWRADIIQKFVDELITMHNLDEKSARSDHDAQSHTEWNKDYNITTDMSMRLLLAIKLVSSIGQRSRITNILEIIQSMSDEEVSFWVWKILSLKHMALNGFKAMYLKKQNK